MIAISTDKKEQGFQKKLAYHQWLDNYCDSSGMAGVNFTNYGVLSVPKLFLLDQEGTVLKKTAMADELITFINKVNPFDPTLVLLSKTDSETLEPKRVYQLTETKFEQVDVLPFSQTW